MLTYFQRIGIWEAAAKMGPKARAPQLLFWKEGDALEKKTFVALFILTVDKVAELFKRLIQGRFEPMEQHRAGKIMDSFLFEFSRTESEQVACYDDRFNKELARVGKVSGELNDAWKAHLFKGEVRLREDRGAKSSLQPWANTPWSPLVARRGWPFQNSAR